MDWKKLCMKLLHPPAWLTVMLTLICAASLPYVLIKGLSEHPIAYCLYVLSFYTLCVLSYLSVRLLPGSYKRLVRRIHAHPLGHRYMTEAAFRTRVSLYASLFINLFYVAINLLSWFLFRSYWFVVLAVYYVILSVMRYLLLGYVRINELGQNTVGELKRARLCSAILLLLNFVLTGAVMMILYQNKGFEYQGILIYVMAAYTFYITAHAIVDLVRYRKYRSPVMTSSKLISLCAALVSMLALETAMFSQFGGDMAAEDRRLVIALTGAGVSIAVIVLSVLSLIYCSKEIKKEKNGR